jgi:hypothetical protein
MALELVSLPRAQMQVVEKAESLRSKAESLQDVPAAADGNAKSTVLTTNSNQSEEKIWARNWMAPS